MATFKMHGMVTKFEKKLVDGMTKKGYSEEFAGVCSSSSKDLVATDFPKVMRQALPFWSMFPVGSSATIRTCLPARS